MPRLRPDGTYYPSMLPQVCDYCGQPGNAQRKVVNRDGARAHSECRPPMLCSKRGCDQPRKANGLCSGHYNRVHYADHAEAMRHRSRDWMLANLDKVTARAAERKHSGRAAEASRRWYWANRLTALAAQHNRRAARYGVPGVVTADQLAGRLAVHGDRCYLCGGVPHGFDHVKPLSAGGPNFASNLRPVCISCNSTKGATWKETA